MPWGWGLLKALNGPAENYWYEPILSFKGDLYALCPNCSWTKILKLSELSRGQYKKPTGSLFPPLFLKMICTYGLSSPHTIGSVCWLWSYHLCSKLTFICFTLEWSSKIPALFPILWSSYIHSIVVSKILFTLNPQPSPLYPSRPSFTFCFLFHSFINHLFFLNWFFCKNNIHSLWQVSNRVIKKIIISLLSLTSLAGLIEDCTQDFFHPLLYIQIGKSKCKVFFFFLTFTKNRGVPYISVWNYNQYALVFFGF